MLSRRQGPTNAEAVLQLMRLHDSAMDTIVTGGWIQAQIHIKNYVWHCGNGGKSS